MRVRAIVVIVLAGAAIGALPAGCGSDDRRELFLAPADAGLEAEAEAGPPDAEAQIDPTIGGPCVEDGQCDDAVPCTYDSCDPTLKRCRNVPDDTQCDDGTFCNGKEVCLLRQGCIHGAVVTCQDDDVCTVDRCVESTKTCDHAVRDVDGDGDPDDHCVGSRDCNDHDPTVSSTHSEVCGNLKDDDCDGQIDEQPCDAPSFDTCGTAFAVTATGNYLVSTVATAPDYTSFCTVRTPSAGHDIVVAFSNPGPDPVNIDVRAVSERSGDDVALTLETDCGTQATTIECANFPLTGSARAIARQVAPGTTVYGIVATQGESTVALRVSYEASAPPPTNETCAAPAPIALETAFTVSIIDAATNLFTNCGASTGELTYSFDLPTASDVRVFASNLDGPGVAVPSIRGANCVTEYRCQVGDVPPLFARNLAAGPHILSVAATAQLDAAVTVRAYPPTTAPDNQACGTAPVIQPNAFETIDLSSNEAAQSNGCLTGLPAAVYNLTIFEPSDVLLVGSFGSGDAGGVSLTTPGCTPSDLLGCTQGDLPTRVSKRNLPAGAYRVGIGDQRALTVRLDALVRPTVAPTAVTASDNCVDYVTIPPEGGFFTGDTSMHAADFSAGCDVPGLPIGGAKDQLLRLDLANPQRVVMDMTGSTFQTVIDLRQGTACPGIEVPDSCFVGGGPGRSFVDKVLPAGTYWIQVDGYANADGQWNLDVRLLPP